MAVAFRCSVSPRSRRAFVHRQPGSSSNIEPIANAQINPRCCPSFKQTHNPQLY